MNSVYLLLTCTVGSVNSIKGDFPDEPVMWDAVARRQWEDTDTSLLTGKTC